MTQGGPFHSITWLELWAIPNSCKEKAAGVWAHQVVNNLINHAHIMEPQKFWQQTQWCLWVGRWTHSYEGRVTCLDSTENMEALDPLISPRYYLCGSSIWLSLSYTLYNKIVIINIVLWVNSVSHSGQLPNLRGNCGNLWLLSRLIKNAGGSNTCS